MYHSMMFFFISVLWSTVSLALDTTLPDGLSYESRKNEKHVIHILTIDPTRYHLKLVKAHNQVFGGDGAKKMASSFKCHCRR